MSTTGTSLHCTQLTNLSTYPRPNLVRREEGNSRTDCKRDVEKKTDGIERTNEWIERKKLKGEKKINAKEQRQKWQEIGNGINYKGGQKNIKE